MKYKDKTREFEVKLESIDPTGVILKSEELSMMIVDDQESMINNDRLFIHIGECLYRVDKKGFIIERVIPHESDDKQSFCDVCNGDGIDDSSFYNSPCGRCKGTGKQTVL